MAVYKRPIRSDELYHFGVLGMKWGVRRYQNDDGTLTAAGKKHYDSVSNNKLIPNSMGGAIAASIAGGTAFGIGKNLIKYYWDRPFSDKVPKENWIKYGKAAVASSIGILGALSVSMLYKENAKNKVVIDKQLKKDKRKE